MKTVRKHRSEGRLLPILILTLAATASTGCTLNKRAANQISQQSLSENSHKALETPSQAQETNVLSDTELVDAYTATETAEQDIPSDEGNSSMTQEWNLPRLYSIKRDLETYRIIASHLKENEDRRSAQQLSTAALRLFEEHVEFLKPAGDYLNREPFRLLGNIVLLTSAVLLETSLYDKAIELLQHAQSEIAQEIEGENLLYGDCEFNNLSEVIHAAQQATDSNEAGILAECYSTNKNWPQGHPDQAIE